MPVDIKVGNYVELSKEAIIITLQDYLEATANDKGLERNLGNDAPLITDADKNGVFKVRYVSPNGFFIIFSRQADKILMALAQDVVKIWKV